LGLMLAWPGAAQTHVIERTSVVTQGTWAHGESAPHPSFLLGLRSISPGILALKPGWLGRNDV